MCVVVAGGTERVGGWWISCAGQEEVVVKALGVKCCHAGTPSTGRRDNYRDGRIALIRIRALAPKCLSWNEPVGLWFLD